MLKGLRVVVAALGIVGVCTAALAHVSLETKQAKVGGSYKAVFGIPHGCEGQPTTEVSIEIPEGVIGVKPMPKSGWTLVLEKGPYARTYKFHHGETKSEGVKRVTWSGGSLPDEYFDQFVLSTFIAGELPPDTRIYFPVTQKCASGELRWSEVPAEGQDAHSLEYPAAGLALVSDEVKKQDKVAGAMAVAGGAIEIGQPWTRPVGNAGGVGAGYAVITNNGTEADELLGGSSESAERVEMHETSIDDKGVASMKKLGSVPLQSGQSIELKPGGMHIMFIGLKEPQKKGGILKAKLKFKKAGEVDVEFAVKAAGPDSVGGHGGHEHMHHDH